MILDIVLSPLEVALLTETSFFSRRFVAEYLLDDVSGGDPSGKSEPLSSDS